MLKKLQRKYFPKQMQKSKKGVRKRIVISTENGNLSIYARDLITYLKNHKFRLIARPVPVRIAECLSPILLWVGSSLTTKYVITEEAKQAYSNGNEELLFGQTSTPLPYCKPAVGFLQNGGPHEGRSR